MKIHHIMWKELRHRKLGALILLLGIILCVGLIVAVQRARIASGEEIRRTMVESEEEIRRTMAESEEEIRRAMLEMGKNIVILPQTVSLDQYWAGDFGDNTLPQTDVGVVAKFCSQGKLLARHFLGSLQRKIEIDGKPVILCGITVEIDPGAPESLTKDAQRPLESSEAELGPRAAQRLELKAGDSFFISPPPKAKRLKVIKVRPETGTVDDFKVFVDIRVAQELFGVGKVVNVIEAVSCMCAPQMLPMIAKQIEKEMTNTGQTESRVRAYHFMAIATARFKSREAAATARFKSREAIAAARLKAHEVFAQNANVVTYAALVFSALIISGYSILNARERRREMGILLAIAVRPRHVAWLILLKMLTLGTVAGLIGTCLGDQVAVTYGPPLAATLRPALWQMYGLAVGLALVLTVIPSLIGVILASRTDPAETLREL